MTSGLELFNNISKRADMIISNSNIRTDVLKQFEKATDSRVDYSFDVTGTDPIIFEGYKLNIKVKNDAKSVSLYALSVIDNMKGIEDEYGYNYGISELLLPFREYVDNYIAIGNSQHIKSSTRIQELLIKAYSAFFNSWNDSLGKM